MSDFQEQDRTEAPTPRRRERARQEGQVVFSPDLSSGAMLLIVSLSAVFLWNVLQEAFALPIRESIIHLRMRDWGASETVLAGKWLMSHFALFACAVFILTTGSTLLLTQLQSGLTLTWQPLTPKWDKLSPTNGWNRLLSIDSLARGGLAVCKLATSLGIVLCLFYIAATDYRRMNSGQSPSSIPVEQQLFLSLVLSLSGVTLAWGMVDYAIRWFRNEQKLKMSKQEIKDEQKEDQGDPQIRSRLRRAQQEAARRRTLQDVPMATMVITNPTHYAVALKYQTGKMSAPTVVCKGTDAFARRIAETARQNGIPVFERKPLTRAIYAMAEVGDEIPVEFYRAIAELLAEVYRIKGKFPEQSAA